MNTLKSTLLSALVLWSTDSARASVETGDVQSIYPGWPNPYRKMQAHYDADSSCETVVLLNVGTSMSVTDYQKMGKAIAKQDSTTVAIIMDSKPGWIPKTDGKRFAKVANAIAEKLGEFVEVCQQRKQAPKYLIGGHSGGGQGAVEALQIHQSLAFTPAGFVGLAPFKIEPNELNITIPSLNIGFSTQSCWVTPTLAALAAYQNSNPRHRVFYQVQTNNRRPISGPHCSFADAGCFLLCKGDNGSTNGTKMNEWMHGFVGQTIQLFRQAIASQKFDRRHLKVPFTDDFQVSLFVGDQMPAKSESFAFLPAAIAPVTPVWPNQFSADFYIEYWGNLWWQRSTNKGSYSYDWTNGQSLEHHGLGQKDNWCGCASKSSDDCRILSYSADNPHNYKGQAATYALVGDVCCLLFEGVGPLEPTWLESPAIQYAGEEKAGYPERLCHGWENTKPGNKLFMTGDLWSIDQDGTPCGYKDVFKWWAKLLGLGHYFSFDNSTYSQAVDAGVFQLPSDCQQVCPNRNDSSKRWCDSTWSG